MIDIKSRVHCEAAMAKVTTAEAAAALIKDGMNIGVSGFTPSGYPKAVPLALAERAKTDPLKINLWTGASVGPEIDSALTNAGVVARRLPYQTNNDLRKAINNGSVKYTDLHLSHVAQMARYGFMYGRHDVDIAIIEACIIKDLGNGQIGIRDNREGKVGVLGVVDVGNPLMMFFNRVGRKAERLHISLCKLISQLRRAPHLGRADRGKVGGMAEEKDPAVASPIVQADFTHLGVDGEIGGDIANMERHLQFLF